MLKRNSKTAARGGSSSRLVASDEGTELRSFIVHLREYSKREHKDPSAHHHHHSSKTAYERPFLLVISSGKLELMTTGDGQGRAVTAAQGPAPAPATGGKEADDDVDGDAVSVESSASSSEASVPAASSGSKSHGSGSKSLKKYLHKLTGVSGKPPRPAAGAPTADATGPQLQHTASTALGAAFDPDDSKVFSLTVALTELLEVERQGDHRLKIYYQPNKPFSTVSLTL